MKNLIKYVLGTFVFVLSLSGCSNNNVSTGASYISSSLTEPTYLQSYDELNEYILSANAYVAKDNKQDFSVNEVDKQDLDIAVSQWNLGQLQNYYMPSWVPNDFKLSQIVVTERYFAYYYIPKDYDLSAPHSHEDSLNNVITFEWTRVETGDKLLENRIGANDLVPAEGVENLYYTDFGTTDNPDDFLHRNYYWLEDGYCFMLAIPIRVIDEIEQAEVSLDLNKSVVLKNSRFVEIDKIDESITNDINVDELVAKSVMKVVLGEK